MKKFILCILLFTITIQAQTINEAKKLFDETQKHKEAIEIFQNYKNDGEAQYYLGKAYLYGMGVDKDVIKGLKLAQKSANLKNASGINLLAVFYQYGYGVEKDELQALIYYKEAAKLGNAKAMKNIGLLYQNGEFIQKNLKESLKWFQKALPIDSDAYLNIGDLYYENHQDSEALKWYLKYETIEPTKVSDAFYERVGLMYLSFKNFTQAYEYILKATQLGAYRASWVLFDMVINNQVSVDKKQEALDWLIKISDPSINKSPTVNLSQRLLYRYYLDDSNQQEKAIQLATSAYQYGNIEMGCNLASYYGNNFENEIDYEKSYNIASEIVKNNNPSMDTRSCYMTLAYLYRTGYYTSKDIQKSIEMYKLMFYDIGKGKDDLIATWIAKYYLEDLKDFENAQKWYQIAYDLTKDAKYLTIVEEYKKTLPIFEDTNFTNEQTIFPIIDNFHKKEQVASVLESDEFYFIATDSKDVKIYDKTTLRLQKELRGWIGSGAEGIVTQMAYDEKRLLLYCSGMNSTADYTKNDVIKVFDIKTGTIVKIIDNKNSMLSTYLNISEDGKYLVSINNNDQLQVIDTTTNELQYYSFSNRINFKQVNIIKKDDDYVVNALGNDNNLYSFSVNKKRQISKEPFAYQTAFKSFNSNHAQNILKTDVHKIDNLTFDANQIYLKNNQGVTKSFDIKNLTLSDVNAKIDFSDNEKSTIELKLKNGNRTLEVYKENKLFSTIELLYTPIINYKILDEKYIVITTTDVAAMLIFNLKGRPIANLKGFISLQKNIVYKENHLFTYGDDKIVHAWDIANLTEFNNTQEVYEQKFLKSFYKIFGGNVLEMLSRDSLDDNFLESQMKQNQWNFKPTTEQIKSFMKIALLKKENIYPLASLCIKNNDWILFNNQGLFASSKYGQNLIKYHVNQGYKKEAKIIENEKLFDRFYRPDLIKKVLAGEKVNIPLDIKSVIFNIKPPELHILSNQMISKKDIDLIYKVCDAGDGIADPKLLINGQAINPPSSRGFTIQNIETKEDKCKVYRSSHTLCPGENIISLKAYDKDKTIASESAVIKVMADYKVEEKPNLYFLSIAVSDYKDDSFDLKYPVSDAIKVKEKIEQKSKSIYENIYAYELHEKDVNLENINKTFDEIKSNISKNDAFILYIAGHGISKDSIYHFIPYDQAEKISIHEIKTNLSKLENDKSLILLDTCQSGAAINSIVDDVTTVNRLSLDDNRNYIVASSKNQIALEGYKNHGVFTYAILDAFINNNRLKVWGLADHISEIVPKITQEKFHFSQKPQAKLNQNFILIEGEN